MKSFKTKIQDRDVEVLTCVEEGDEWGLFLLGEESKKAFFSHLISGQHIRLWDVADDQEGSEAEKMHNIAVQLLSKTKNKSLQETYKLLSWLAEQVIVEEKRIDQVIDQVLKA